MTSRHVQQLDVRNAIARAREDAEDDGAIVGRSVPEWIGKSPDEPFPPRVRLRILVRFNRRCAGCTRPIRSGDKWTCDHRIALINGGENRESNGQPLCEWCNPEKNAVDVAEKSKVAAMAYSDLGLKKPKGRPMPCGRNSPWKKPFGSFRPVPRNEVAS